MKMLEMNLNLNKIISENDLPQGSIIVFRYTFGELDMDELADIARNIYDFFKKRGIDVIFIPDVMEIESINDCKEIIEHLSKELYKYSELQDKLFKDEERYESF